MTKPDTIQSKILLASCWEWCCGGQEDRLPTMRAILNIGLQHHSFTSLSPIGPSSEKAFAPDFDCAWGEKMRIGTEEVGPSQGCRLGHGLRRVSLWAGESGVSRLGLQYAVTHDPFRRALRHRKLPRMGAPEESVVAHLRRASHLIDWHFAAPRVARFLPTSPLLHVFCCGQKLGCW